MAESSLDPFGDLGSASSSDEMKAKPARKNMNVFNSILRLASSPAFERGMKALDKAFDKWINAEKGTSGGGGSGADQVSRALQKMQSQQSTAGTFQNFMGGFTGSGGVGKAAAFGNVAQVGMQLGSMGIKGIDNRVNNAYGQMLSYDKLSMLYQQTQGITQNQFAKNILQPMSQYKLGTGGASALLGLQASTGLSAQGNAAGIAGLRAATGFAYSTQDMAQMMRTMASPMVNNRMTMTLGTGMYGPGGSQRNMMQVMQQVVRGAGLTNERIVNSGMQIGSVTRARLSAYGIADEGMQDMILNYAKSNIQYQKKGGTGMYDPNNPQAQKLMGIKKNFANEQEETQRVQEARDMQFYKRQNDNYAQLERNTQGLIKAFGALEDKLSGLIGARTSMRNNKNLAIGKTVLGGLMVAGGVAAGIATFGGSSVLSAGLIAGGTGMIGSGMSGFSGDPMPVGKKDFSIGYGGKKMSLSEASNAPSVSKLNPKFRERILKMIQDNPAVGIGQGYRDGASQRRMFLDRYNKTDKKTDIFWEGSYWQKKDGVAPAAPPGFSMHEIGLAADLTGDLDWVQKNAGKYGLKTFGGVNGEPWHVQPAELPNGRSEYEKSGAKWGLGGSTERSDPNARIAGISDGVASDSFGGAKSGGPMSFGQMSIMDSISATRDANRMGLGAGGVVSKAGTKGGRSGAGSVTGSIRRRGKLKPEEVAQLLYSAGFRGDDLAKALAISFRESSHNASAYNGNAKTKDKSYGLFQINMAGDLGPSRMKSQKLKSYEDLYDAETNIRVLRNMYNWNKGHGRDPFYDWGPYKGKDALYGRAGTFYPKAQAIAKQMSGDPAPVGRVTGSGGGGATFVDGGSITIHAPVTIHTGTGSFDPSHIGQEAGRAIERQLRIELMRKN
jgi:hypothetical protein